MKTEAAEAIVMLVLIGSGWLKAQNATTGDRKLNEPDDWVRREVQTALEVGAMVVPILVDDARPLTTVDLRTIPAIADLAERQALRLRHRDWDSDLARLERVLVEKGFSPLNGPETLPMDSQIGGERTQRARELAALAAPLVPHHFRDRESEIRRVAECFQGGRWCALAAIGGSGKTAIAARIAGDPSVTVPDRVVWVGLAGTLDADVPQEWLANAFGFSVRAESTAQHRSARLRSITAGASALIVFDDATSDAQLSELLGSVGDGNYVLVTTREQLPCLARFGIETIDVPPLPQKDATDVLLSITGTSAHDLDTRREWSALAQAVGNHPLSLEVLAGDLLLQDQWRPSVYLADRISSGTWSEGEETLERLRKSVIENVTRSGAGYELGFAALGAFEGSAFSVAAVTDVSAFDSQDRALRFLISLRRRLCIRRQRNGLYSLHPFVTETARHTHAPDVTMSPQQSAPVLRHIAYYHKLLRVYGGYELNMERYPALVPEERELVHAIEAAAGLSDQAAPSQAYARRVDCAEMTSLISWYLHWRGLWDLRIRLCERVCGWADQGMLPDMSGLVGNLYVDQGWIHLQRGDIDHAESCASRGRGWLETTSDWIFAAELAAQIALRRQDYSSAIDGFELLRRETQNESRFFMVLSYRLADALREAGDPGRALALLEDLLERIGSPEVGDGIDDVHGRILYRIALQRRDAGQAGEALALARRSVVAFARSGIRAAERGAAIILVAGLLSQSGATDDCRNFLIGVQHQAERESDFETLTEITKALAGLESGSSPIRTDSLQLTDL